MKASIITRLFRGQVLSSDFFARHWLPVLICIVVIMVYITTKYTCQTNMEKIAALFMGRKRETSMQHMVDSLHLNLKVQAQPPYKIPK